MNECSSNMWQLLLNFLDKLHWRKKSGGGPKPCRWLNHLPRTSNLVSLSNSSMLGTAFFIALSSSAGKIKSRGRLAKQMMKSLMLLWKFTKSSHSRITNQYLSILEHNNNMWHHNFNCFDRLLWKKNQEVGLIAHMTKSLTLLWNFTKGSHSRSTNTWIAVLEHINNVRHHTLNCLDKFH